MPLDMTKAEHIDSADQRVFMSVGNWSGYERLLELRGERAVPRIAYLDGELELMSPSGAHESINFICTALLLHYCVVRGIDVRPVGSWTIKTRSKRAGVEPDTCFIFGAERKRRPDLAIEVVWTSGGLEKLEIYRRIGVPEVWFWQEGTFAVHVLEGEKYRARRRSKHLPDLDLVLLSELSQLDLYNDALRRWDRALRR